MNLYWTRYNQKNDKILEVTVVLLNGSGSIQKVNTTYGLCNFYTTLYVTNFINQQRTFNQDGRKPHESSKLPCFIYYEATILFKNILWTQN